MIELIIPGTKTKLKIIRAIYEKPGINITELIKETRSSPNTVLAYTNELARQKIIKQVNIGGKKKIHIKRLFPDFSSENSRLIFSLVEHEKKMELFKRYKEIVPYMEQMNDLFHDSIAFALLYGSYARSAATEESDIDIIVVGALEPEKRQRLKEIFSTSKAPASIKTETLPQFLKNREKPLYQNILKEHIIICGSYKFVSMIEQNRPFFDQ
ncbi:MAG TPA: nucleotidyltransferase domain-containing protein [archaeon]|nr:nucleotidyltransferase domain-containing protein [archaeon]